MYKKKNIFDNIKSFDIYQKLPNQYLKPTLIGAILTLFSIIISYYLFKFEFKKYFQKQLTSNLNIDLSPNSNMIHVNIDISLFKIPCSIIDLDISDLLGNIDEIKLSKQKIGKNGIDISGIIKDNFTEDILENKNITTKHNEEIYNFTKNEFLNENGCRMFGSFDMRRIPGNFYFTVRHHMQTMEKLDENMDFNFNFSHKVNYLSFGYENDLKYVKNKYKIGKLNPLDNNLKIDDKQALTHNYYLNIVPSEYYGENDKIYKVFQLTANYLLKSDSDELPEIAFYYNLSPIKIVYKIINPNNFDGIVNICAIIGGIFTIAGILNSFLLRITKVKEDKRF